MESSATSQGNKRSVGYKDILTFFIYSSLITERSHGAACAGGVSPSSSYRDILSFPNFISYLADFLFFFSENQTRFFSDWMSLVCQSRVSLVRKLGACERTVLQAKWSVWLVWTAPNVQFCLCLLRAGCCLRGEESLLWVSLNSGKKRLPPFSGRSWGYKWHRL